MKSNVLRSEWTTIFGVFALILSAAGCSSSVEQPSDETSRSSPPSQSQAAKPVASMKLPAAEFQQPPVLPPIEPLPRPAEIAAPLRESPLTPELTQAQNPPPEQVRVQLPPVTVPAEKDWPSRVEKVEAVAADKIEAEAAEKPQDDQRQPASPLSTGKHSGQKFDPIAINGKIFDGWSKPKVAIVLTGVEDGYLEPCGCAGLEWMKGGMSRRHTFLQELRKKGWPVVALDVGGLARGFGPQAEIKFHTLVESKIKMEYDAIGFGVDDLRLPVTDLVSVAAAVEDKPSLFVSANVGLLGFDAKITPTHRVIEAGGLRIGVTAILGKQYQKDLSNPKNPEIEMIDPEAALARIVPELKRTSDYRVLLAYATMDESLRLAKKFPEFDAVVVSDGPEIPPQEIEPVEAVKPKIITVGHKGMYAIVLGLFDSPLTVRDQRVPLDSRFAASPDMKMLMAAYQDQLKMVGFDKLDNQPHTQDETNGKFVGSKKCQSCHEESYDVWKKSKHAKAYETLAKLDPPRNFDPECVSCHVIGWHPTMFFPFKSGFESLEKTPEMLHVGCEDCHGPGEKHCAVELSGSDALKAKYRKAVVITKEESQKHQCVTCHDLDNSPDFKFESYYPLIEHHEEK